MEGENEIVTEHTESTVTTAPPASDGGGDTSGSEVVAETLGTVAAAEAAVALANQTASSAELTAAETIRSAEQNFENRLLGVETWRSEHEAAIMGLATEVQDLRAQNSSIQSSLAELMAKLQSAETKPLSEVTPDENVVVEDQEAAPKKRHRLI